jgi:5-methylcytosine-specific restriction endonuclease McrA
MAFFKYDWVIIQRRVAEGKRFVDCQREFGVTGTAWTKAIRAGRLQTPGRRRYDWAEIQRYYDAGHSYRQCRAKFGFNAGSWQKARLRGAMRTRPMTRPLHEFLASSTTRWHVRVRLLREGLLREECYECGLRTWRGRPLSLQLDHVNGIKNDHRLENLRFLCPNCHSQTDTFGVKNRGRNSRVV